MITQALFSKRVKHFESGFLKKWGLKRKYSDTQPCVFVGLYGIDDFNNIKAHKGLKILMQTGTLNIGLNNEHIYELSKIPNMFFVNYKWCEFPDMSLVKDINIPIKDYSIFKPTVFGDKIYCFLGTKKHREKRGHALAMKIKNNIDHDILFGYRDKGLDKDIIYLRDNYYSECFLNLNLSVSGMGGFTSAHEMAHMGRMTLMNTKRDYPFIIPFTEDNIVDLINREAEKIGTIQEGISVYNIGEEWLETEFWK